MLSSSFIRKSPKFPAVLLNFDHQLCYPNVGEQLDALT